METNTLDYSLVEQLLDALLSFICGSIETVLDWSQFETFVVRFVDLLPTFKTYLENAAFFLPLQYMGPLFFVVFAIMILRITMAIAHLILDILPF